MTDAINQFFFRSMHRPETATNGALGFISENDGVDQSNDQDFSRRQNVAALHRMKERRNRDLHHRLRPAAFRGGYPGAVRCWMIAATTPEHFFDADVSSVGRAFDQIARGHPPRCRRAHQRIDHDSSPVQSLRRQAPCQCCRGTGKSLVSALALPFSAAVHTGSGLVSVLPTDWPHPKMIQSLEIGLRHKHHSVRSQRAPGQCPLTRAACFVSRSIRVCPRRSVRRVMGRIGVHREPAGNAGNAARPWRLAEQHRCRRCERRSPRRPASPDKI